MAWARLSTICGNGTSSRSCPIPMLASLRWLWHWFGAANVFDIELFAQIFSEDLHQAIRGGAAGIQGDWPDKTDKRMLGYRSDLLIVECDDRTGSCNH